MRMNQTQLDALREIVAQSEYQLTLDRAVRKARRVLAGVGCTVRKVGPMVTLCSPRTGKHSLHMSLGVRPVSDLMAHVEGFAENNAPKGQWLNEAIAQHNAEVRTRWSSICKCEYNSPCDTHKGDE